MNTFTLNDKQYEAKEFDFNFICDLEEMGLSIADAPKKPMALARIYIGFCMGEDKNTAGMEIEQHIINGGSFDEVMKLMNGRIDDSDFFRALDQKKEKKTTKSTSQTK